MAKDCNFCGCDCSEDSDAKEVRAGLRVGYFCGLCWVDLCHLVDISRTPFVASEIGEA